VPAEHTVARIGGDEFVVVLHEVQYPQDAQDLARDILAMIEKPARVCGTEVFVSASIGISLFPDDGRDPDTLVQHADAALYRAKERGRNTWQVYTDTLQQQASERLKLETELRHALSRGELLLHYQPVMDLRTGRVHSFEALLRWQHPQRGLLSPASFIAHAETSRTLASLGDWILRTACTQVSRWAAKGHTALSVAVNISARQFREPGLLTQVERVLAETGLPPAQLELEITESHAMEHAEETLKTLAGLKALGVRIAIDDFGTGYSSLAYLKRFEIHTLKLDRSMLEGIPTGDGDAAIATAILQLAHTLGLSVVAEGVETQEQLHFLERQGCDRVQGFLYSRPLPASGCEAFLARNGSVEPERNDRVVRLADRVGDRLVR
jgi:EAL domain-containing protein (putative c-di-GMP-specific phosphodiesterase class I)